MLGKRLLTQEIANTSVLCFKCFLMLWVYLKLAAFVSFWKGVAQDSDRESRSSLACCASWPSEGPLQCDHACLKPQHSGSRRRSGTKYPSLHGEFKTRVAYIREKTTMVLVMTELSVSFKYCVSRTLPKVLFTASSSAACTGGWVEES